MTTAAGDGMAALNIGDRGDDVRRLQVTLRILGAQVPADEAQSGAFGEGTATALREWQESVRLDPSGAFDERTSGRLRLLAAEQPERIVLGRVTDADGRPLQGLVVRAFDANLGGEQPLADDQGDGTAVTDGDGRYELRYSIDALGRAGKTAADLVVRAFDGDAEDEPAAASPITFAAEPVEVVPLVAGPAVASSTYERLLARIGPALDGTALDAVDTSTDLTYLAGTTGVDQAELAALARAAELAAQAGRLVAGDPDAEAATAAARDAPTFYAWARAEPAADLATVLTATPTALGQRLAEAARDGLVPGGSDPAAVTRAAVELKARWLLRPADPGQPASPGDVLGTIPADRRLDDAAALAVTRKLAEQAEPSDALWTALSAAGLADAQVRDVRLAFGLDDLAGGNVRLLEALQAETPAQHDGTAVHLAALPANRWMELVAAAADPGADAAAIAPAAAELSERVERRHPSAAFKARLEGGLMRGTAFPVASVAGFLGDHAGFDLVDTAVEPYLVDANVADEELRAGLLTAQRLLRVGATQSEVAVLVGAQLGDLAGFALRGREELAAELRDSIPAPRLATLQGRAQQLLTAALGAASVFAPRFYEPLPALGGTAPAAASAPPGFPSVGQLFGDQSACRCGRCRSVLGPAAYLVDLLHLLDRTGFGGQLQNRRPDLAELELSCANTDTTLPYVDLVLEILESAVAFPTAAVALTPAEADQLEAGTVPPPLRAELALHVIDDLGPLAVEVAAQQVLIFPPYRRITVRDPKRRWPASLWRRQLIVRRISGSTTLFPVFVPAAEIDATRQALAAGQVPANLVTLIAPEPEAPVDGAPVVTPAPPPDDQVEHSVVLQRSLVVELFGNPAIGAIRLERLDGVELRSVPVQPGIIVLEIAQQLAAGRVHPYLANLLPQLPYAVTADPQPPAGIGRWRLAATVTATVRFTPDRVVVQGQTYGSSDGGNDTLFAQNRDPEAYRRLNAATFPLDLPFDVFREEVRACLAIAGSSRLQLLRALTPGGRYATVDEACEVLDAAPAQLAVITEPAAGPARAAELWGLTESGNALTDPLDPSAPPVPADWVGALSRASVLLDRSRAELPTLQALFASRWLAEVAPDIHVDPLYECRASRITVVGLGQQSLDRLQRLLRLLRVTGWPVRDTDLVLRALTRPGSGPLTGDPAIRALAEVQELARRTRAPVRLVAAWLGALETAAYVDREADDSPTLPSLYDETFADPRHRGPGFADFALDAGGAELAYITGQATPNPTYLALTDRLAYAATALRLRPAELAELVGSGPLAVVADRLSFATLSTLLRHVSLARAAGLSVAESRSLQRVTGLDPVPAQLPAPDVAGRRIQEFLDAVEAVRASAFTVEELAWCLQGTEPDETARMQRRLDQLRWLTDLQAALREIQPAADGQTTDAALRGLLRSAGWPDSLVDRLLDGEGGQLGLRAQPELDVPVAAAAPPALPPAGPFVLTVAGPGRYRLGLVRPPAAADFNALDQVPGIGPLATPTAPAARLRSAWDALVAGTRSLTRWLQSQALPRVSVPLRFTVLRPRDGQTPRAVPAEGLGPAMRLNAAGDVELDGFLTGADARRLRAWVTGATNEDAVRAVIAPLVGVPAALGVPTAPLNYEPVLRALTLVGYPAAADVTALAALVNNADYAAAVQALAAAANAFVEQRPSRRLLDGDAVLRLFLERPAPQQRYAAVQDALVGPLRRQRAAALVGARTGLDRRLVDALDAAAASSAPPLDALAELASEALLGVAIRDVRAADTLSEPLAALDRWDRAGLLIRRLGMQPAEAPWLDTTTGFVGLDPLGLGPAGAAAYGRWRAAVDLFALRDFIPGAGATLERVRGAPSVAAGLGVLAEAFSVATADVTALLALDTPVNQLAQLRDPAVLRRVVDACRLLRRLRAPAAALATLCVEPVDAPAVAAARGLVLARPEAAAAAPGSVTAAGELRDRQRAALVAFLIARDGARDASDLHARYLLDAEMGPLLRTSRIKQAIGSTQLFIQRLLMNLEGGSTGAIATLARRVAWAGNQQVWEANRRVFLHPENWLEPSLRDDKTHLFRKLEGELLQGDLTTERAIALFGDYLLGLQEISRLTVRSLFLHAVSSTESVLHVVARTPDQPLRFFYRQLTLVETARQWTPWEPVESVTNTEHAVCFVRGRRPYIAWLQVGRAVDQTGAPTTQAANWDVELLWCFRTNDGWSAPQKWGSRLRHPVLVNKDERQSFALRVHDHGGAPQLRVYGARELGETQQQVNPFPLGTQVLPTNRSPKERSTSHRIEVQVVGELTTTTGTSYFAINDAKVELWGSWWIYYQLTGQDYRGTNTPAWPQATAPQTLTIQSGAGSATWSIPLLVYTTQPDGTVLIYQVVDAWARVYIRVTVGGVAQTVGPITLDPLQNNVLKHGVRYSIAPDDPRFQASRPIRLVHLASFDWDNSLGLRGGPPGDGSELTAEIAVTTHESSGLREGPTDAPVVLDGRALTRPTAVDRFFAVGSTGTDRIRFGAPLYVEEADAAAFLVRRSVDDTWTLLPASEYVAGDVLAAITADGETLDLGPQNTVSRVQAMLTRIAPAADVSVAQAAYDAQFALPNAASTYDWEVYFHIPYLIATALGGQQRYAEALRWLHLIFDPTQAGSTAADAWRLRPLRAEAAPSIEQLLTELARGTLDTAAHDALRAQLDFWTKHPFQPHGIARMRLRAYQWMVVFKYVELRIAWGDLLFRRDTLESRNEATQQYLLAAQLLGSRPPRMPEQPPPIAPLTYAALADRWDDFSNAWVSLADLPFFKAWLAFLQWLEEHGIVGPDGGTDLSETLHRLQSVGSLVFCVPANDRTDELRATVADRLTKLRASQNIDGVFRQPPLYEPAIDPALLVRAVAAGLDIDTVLNDISAPTPQRRFSASLQRAVEFTGEVRSLEGMLLGALEKRDGEELGRLRAVDERALLDLMTVTRQRELDEANAALAAVRQTRETALTRYRHFQRLLGKQQVALPQEQEQLTTEPTRLQLAGSIVDELDPSLRGYGLTIEEVDQLRWMTVGNTFSLIGGGFQVASGIAHMVPNFTTSWFEQEVTFGGTNVGSGLGAVGQFFSMLASNASFQGTRSSIVAGHQRRYDDWVLQANLAAREIEGVDRQLVSAEIRVDIARRAVESHRTQLENARRNEDFLRRKFTNQELYQWMCDRLAQAHSAAFQLAYELAKTAERALARDLGIANPGIVRYGAWENARRGLLAGEQLAADLKQLEAAYLQGDAREFEITKHVALSELDPVELLRLRQTGACTFEVPETAFDMDFPGQYFRRLRSVSVSVPCVVGPYRSAAGTLTLLGSRTRVSAAPRPYAEAADDPRFTVEPGGEQSIATSSAQSDSGLFELDFRDERYLPFERSGAISQWHFALPRDFRPFDYRTITDLVLHLRYTARDGGAALAATATSNLRALFGSAAETGALARTISLRRRHASAWQRLTDGSGTPQDVVIDESEFPYMLAGAGLAIWKVAVFVEHDGPADDPARVSVRCPQTDAGGDVALTEVALELEEAAAIDGLSRYDGNLVDDGLDPVPLAGTAAATTWQFELAAGTAYHDVVLAFWCAGPVDAGAPRLALARTGGGADDADGIEALRSAAAAGDGAAAFTLWERLRERDFDVAEGWLRAASELGDVRAAARLGQLLWERGELDGAEAQLRRGALDPQGAYALGRLLWLERHEPEAAIQWLDRAAQADDPAAQRDLGLLLRDRGDHSGARYWLERAADRDEAAREALAEFGDPPT